MADDQASAAAIKPRYPMPMQTVADARQSLAEHMRAFFERVWAWHRLPEHERELPEYAGIMTL